MWTTPEKQTKGRETLRNANQNKTTSRAGYKIKAYGKKAKKKKKKRKKEKKKKKKQQQKAFRIKGAL